MAERRWHEVEAWLAAHLGEAERLRDWARMSDAVRRAVSKGADEAIPARLGLAASGRNGAAVVA